jgi:hypothetical protein
MASRISEESDQKLTKNDNLIMHSDLLVLSDAISRHPLDLQGVHELHSPAAFGTKYCQT